MRIRQPKNRTIYNVLKTFSTPITWHSSVGVAFPDPPNGSLRCNWICNGKAPVLAHYPLDPEYPTHGGFKGVLFTWTNGQTQIPHGSPNYGEYLDAVWFAFPERAGLGWNQVNATAYAWLASEDSIDWDTKAPTYDVDWIVDRTGRKVDRVMYWQKG
jgi:hypothetical protein